MVVDATNNSFASTITQAPGEALVVSPDGTQIIVADRSAKLLRFFNSTANTVTNFPAALDANVAPAAKFSPDGTRAYIVSGAKLFVFQSGAVSTLTLAASATDVGFLANGNAAYLANSTTSRILSCDNSIANGPGGAPTFVGSLPNGTQILGAESDKINAIDVTVNPAALNSSSACPSVTENLVPHGIPAGAPEQLIVTPDSTKAFVTSRARTGSLVAYDVGANAAAGTPGTITLAGAMAATAGTTTGGTTLDSKTLYVGATDNAVHVIDISAGTDAAQVPVPFTPDFVAVRPH
jgi:hypothetical protein